ncbi:MAG: pyrimidine reductase family protein [Mycobacterium sp.]|jgi:riboflavin biosynthesis pyrimidine reductase
MTESHLHLRQTGTVNGAPRVGTVHDIAELASFYSEPPQGVRVNVIFSADGAATFGGRAGPLSSETDQQLLKILRGFADVVLVGAATARAEDYGPLRLTEIQQAQRHGEGRTKPPPIAVISRTGELPTRLVSNPDQPPLLVTCAESPRHDAVGDQRCGVLVAGEGSVDVVRAIALLRSHGLSRILCEGGPTLLDELVTADAVDEICVTLAPKLVAHQPVGLRRPPSQLPIPTMLRLEHALTYGDYVFLKYRR